MQNIGHIYINGAIGKFEGEEYTEFVDVVAQVNRQKDSDVYKVYINSVGGYVDEGFEIYDFLKSLGKPIITIGQGVVASIATVIFMAGGTRILKPNTEFMIHLPSGAVEGTAEDIEEYNDFIQKAKKRITKFYNELTGLSEDVLLPLLRKETYLDPLKAFELGFSNVEPKELKAVAKYNKAPKKMSEQKTDLSKEEFNLIEKFFNKLSNLFGDKPKNITLQTAEETEEGTVELEFPDVTEGQTVAVGDMAMVNGTPAEGEYLMPDGMTYVFASGELTEIREVQSASEEEQTIEDLLEQLTNAENERLEALEKAEQSEARANEAENKLKEANKQFQEFKATLKTKFNFEDKKTIKKENKPVNKTEESSTASLKQKIAERRAKRGQK